jgi:peptidoglycan/LPS O-acetylase OafA/YrhL
MRDDIATNPFVASFMGALVGLKAWPGTSWLDKASNLTLGFLISIIAGPAIVDYLGVSSPRIGAAIAFVCGATGLVLYASVIEGIRQTKFAEIVTRWLGGSK